MGEHIAIRFTYPDGETRTYVIESDWPPPDVFETPDGRFRKVSQSVLEEPHKGVLRGAEYTWES